MLEEKKSSVFFFHFSATPLNPVLFCSGWLVAGQRLQSEPGAAPHTGMNQSFAEQFGVGGCNVCCKRDPLKGEFQTTALALRYAQQASRRWDHGSLSVQMQDAQRCRLDFSWPGRKVRAVPWWVDSSQPASHSSELLPSVIYNTERKRAESH